MPESENATVELTAQCLCKKHTFTAKVPQSSLPLKASACHCNSCRHVTGAMYGTATLWPGDSDAVQESSLSKYVFGETLTTLSCGTCSSMMFWEKSTESKPPTHSVFTGALANIDVPDLVLFTEHKFLGDTIDGGASPWLRSAGKDGARPRLWAGQTRNSEELSQEWPPVDSLPDAAAELDLDKIPIRCRCKGVDLVLHSPHTAFAGKPRSELPWFVDPVTHKLLGNFDACDSCRLSSGADVFHWTFALLLHLGFAGATEGGHSEFPRSTPQLKAAVSAKEGRDPRWGTLTYYESSPDVQRYFCSRCSACVFYAAGRRPEIVDIAVGLLDVPGGARAEGLISWALGGESPWRTDMSGGWREDLIKNIESEAERWRIHRRHSKNWYRLDEERARAKEEAQYR
ncbi:Uu.00g124090.m01.CDS01 [Anthostomella pinea]|uniref:Uu.00g124090.m01.CDS01 n=1 Tax=Anthostomella pinea TaxID=933095 RepID=A0AAI8VHI3_9PEZI|nr:Uu.00g124090.m01.CDS01 [Anthostomella pinea]